jgi:hypothetical protein
MLLYASKVRTKRHEPVYQWHHPSTRQDNEDNGSNLTHHELSFILQTSTFDKHSSRRTNNLTRITLSYHHDISLVYITLAHTPRLLYVPHAHIIIPAYL